MNLLEIKLKNEEDFLKIAETLTRIGVLTKDGTLIQTCHILHKRGKYYICHFKEMFQLDGNLKTAIRPVDFQRRTSIACMLQQWGLCELVDAEHSGVNLKGIAIIPFSKKNDYTFKQNYTIGKKRNNIV